MNEEIKTFQVSTRCGKKPYTVAAYVKAMTAKEAIDKCTNGQPDPELDYAARLTRLPENYWQVAEYMRPDYIE